MKEKTAQTGSLQPVVPRPASGEDGLTRRERSPLFPARRCGACGKFLPKLCAFPVHFECAFSRTGERAQRARGAGNAKSSDAMEGGE